MMKHAAVTIMSRNYLSLGLTLAESWRTHHPEKAFYIVVVDHMDGLDDVETYGAKLIHVEDIGIPEFASFIYRYTLLELNTAVKPFALRYFLDTFDIDTISYIDPDIWFKKPMQEVFDALETSDVVLTPHMRTPFYDNAHPTEVGILQSGTYNLGFVGLKRGEDTDRVLDWWMEKLFLDCIVDIPNGLFVDQKWMDLVPAYVQNHKIIYNPGYNMAYWNLHERKLSFNDGTYYSDDDELVFFHFSGFSPYNPLNLSKHQDRHSVDDNGDLRKICEEYADALLRNGHEYFSALPYGYNVLPNGVKLPLGLIRDCLQDLIRRNITFPDPIIESDAFCGFLFEYNTLPMTAIPPFHYYLLQRRQDVAGAHPNALHNVEDPGYLGWLSGSGISEEKLGDLLKFQKPKVEANDPISHLFEVLRSSERHDVFNHFSDMWFNDEKLLEFADWIEISGVSECGLGVEHSNAIKECRFSLSKILGVYFRRGDLQTAFNQISDPGVLKEFSNWLLYNRIELDLTTSSINFFCEFGLANPDVLEKMRFLYSHYGRKTHSSPTVFDVENRKSEIRSSLSPAYIADWLKDQESYWSIHEQYDYELGRGFVLDEADLNYISPKTIFNIRKTVSEDAEKEFSVNLTGLLNAQIGMGESARSMSRILKAANFKTNELSIPHFTDSYALNEREFFLGYSKSTAQVSISVMNADSTNMLSRYVPDNFWTNYNIGYWVWETETLPEKFSKSARRFDEIWTPSKFSAEAISKFIDKPVKVIPHCLDFDKFKTCESRRSHFGLPEDKVIFGFMFDPNSHVERKNVNGLLEAYEKAALNPDEALLILKINGVLKSQFSGEMLLEKARRLGVLIIDEVYDRDELHDFIASLDVYVSLHRSEGFGLTCAEAMAIGLPVIATGYSGNMEFMSSSNSLLVDAERIATKRTYGPYDKGSVWGDPNVDQAVEYFKKCMNAKFRKEISAKAKRSIKRLEPEAIVKKYMSFLNKSPWK